MEEIVELVYAEIVRSGYANSLAGGIVVTGGGSQLQNLVQLVEYITGMDTRIGYPNEHLGRSKIDSVKSPMYATSVGLVLAGYQPLDQRVEHHTGVNEPVYQKQPEPKATSGSSSNNSGGGLLQKLKGFLSDDIDNKQSY
jgi:cell division protein FtsA